MKTREQAVRALAQTAEDKMLLQQFLISMRSAKSDRT